MRKKTQENVGKALDMVWPSQERWDCHFWEVTDGEDMELTGAGGFGEAFQMWIFARYEVNERRPHQLTMEGSWKWAEDAHKAAKG